MHLAKATEILENKIICSERFARPAWVHFILKGDGKE